MVSEQREIGDNCKIGENVKFVGSVKIGNNCKIGNNVYLNSVSIDNDSIIQDNVVIGYDTITGHFYDQEKSKKTKNNSDESQFPVVIGKNVLIRNGAVSYTHLTLPTIYSV